MKQLMIITCDNFIMLRWTNNIKYASINKDLLHGLWISHNWDLEEYAP